MIFAPTSDSRASNSTGEEKNHPPFWDWKMIHYPFVAIWAPTRSTQPYEPNDLPSHGQSSSKRGTCCNPVEKPFISNPFFWRFCGKFLYCCNIFFCFLFFFKSGRKESRNDVSGVVFGEDDFWALKSFRIWGELGSEIRLQIETFSACKLIRWWLRGWNS